MGEITNHFTIPRRRPFKNVMRIKVVLNDTDPPIWRRIQVPDSYTFYDLHVALQNAMGWTDSHLHMFEIPTDDPKKPIRIDCPYGDVEEPLVTTEIRIDELLSHHSDRAVYIYDFGDWWPHDLFVEAIQPRLTGQAYPLCLDGALACPPEDCGGPPGYGNCLRAYRRRRPKYLVEWLGRWRPDEFDPGRVKFESPRKRFLDSMKD